MLNKIDGTIKNMELRVFVISLIHCFYLVYISKICTVSVDICICVDSIPLYKELTCFCQEITYTRYFTKKLDLQIPQQCFSVVQRYVQEMLGDKYGLCDM